MLHEVHDLQDPVWDKATRGILEATFDVNGAPLTVFANHWPSKRGGSIREKQRLLIGAQLNEIIRQRKNVQKDFQCVVLGDFNANPHEACMGEEGLHTSGQIRDLGASPKAPLLYNPSLDKLHRACQPQASSLHQQLNKYRPQHISSKQFKEAMHLTGEEIGTHMHNSHWGALDQILLNEGLMQSHGLQWVPGSFAVLREKFMTGPDGEAKSFTPQRRSSSDPFDPSTSGFSDHLPVAVRLVQRQS